MKQQSEILELCYNFANELAEAEEDPEQWEQWVFYILTVLEIKAERLDITHPDQYRTMLENLYQNIYIKMENREWV